MRKYDEKLVDIIRDNSTVIEKQGVKVISKPIPDCDIKGAMDPRLYKSSRMMGMMMKFLPKSLFKFDVSPKGIEKLRKPFNNVDSTSFVTGVSEEAFTVKADDGYEIPMYKYTSKNTTENAPILYFIHGGGFFAGRTAVVKEALSYIVDKFGIIAFGIDYRLAPENPYPRGHQDTYIGLNWIYDHAESFGGDKNNIFVAGDSAGGNLTLYNANRNIADGKDMIKGQIVLYPTVNMGGIQDEYTKFSLDKFDIYDKHKHLLTPMIEMFASMSGEINAILGTDDVMNIDLTPYMDVSENMPRTLFTCGEHDALLIETLAYAKKLNDLGVETSFTMYRGMGHAYIDHMGNYPQAEDCANDIGEFILEGASHE